MSIEELHYEFKRRWDKQANNHRKGFTDLEVDQVLNSAINEYVYIYGTGRNPKNYNGLEVNQQMIDMLSTLVMSYPEVSPLPVSSEDSSISSSQLPENYRYFITGKVETKECGLVGITVEQHGDLNSILTNYHRKANKLFKNIPVTIRDKKLYLYHNGIFTPESLRITYVRKPSVVCIGTYTEIPTEINPNPALKDRIDCDLPEDYHDIVLDIAVQEVSRIYLDTARYTLGQNKLNNVT